MAAAAHSPDEALDAGGVAQQPRLLALALGSLGVVFGDIGTSPLYAFREAIAAAAGEDAAPDRADVLGVLSLILWTLTLIVSIKYVLILLRADNHGEGGTLSLMALAQRGLHRPSRWVVVLGILGRRALLWRRDDHAGDLGALGRRRPDGRGAAASSASSCR